MKGQRDHQLERSMLKSPTAGWLQRNSSNVVRVSLGAVFFAFGLLKFVPGASPAENLSVRTMGELTRGRIEGDRARLAVAGLETTVGLSLISGKALRPGLALLGVNLSGVMAPLVLFPRELFSRRFHAPTLEAQYVLKDIVLLGAASVVVSEEMRKRRAELEGKDLPPTE